MEPKEFKYGGKWATEEEMHPKEPLIKEIGRFIRFILLFIIIAIFVIGFIS